MAYRPKHIPGEGFVNTDPITVRESYVAKLHYLSKEPYDSIYKRLHDATSDCAGISRHSWEITWLKNEIKKVSL